MMDIKERKKILIDVIQLEKERDEYEEEIRTKEKVLKKLNMDLEFVQEEYEKLENSGVKKLLLGLTGKREVRLQEAQNEIRRISSELSSVEFAITSAKNRIEHITEELKETDEYVAECLTTIKEMEGGDVIKNSIIISREIPVLRKKINEKNAELKPLLIRAGEIYTYGDINADVSGHRYNKRDSTLRSHTFDIKTVVNELIKLLDEYNLIVPEEIKIEFREEWMDNESYWDGQQLAEDSYDRVKKVDDWFFRFTNLWKKLKTQQNDTAERLRNEILDYLD